MSSIRIDLMTAWYQYLRTLDVYKDHPSSITEANVKMAMEVLHEAEDIALVRLRELIENQA